jgi:hypothetical protein
MSPIPMATPYTHLLHRAHTIAPALATQWNTWLLLAVAVAVLEELLLALVVAVAVVEQEDLELELDFH